MNRLVVIDGKNAILGRLSSYAAKQALLGNEIVIVNCNDVLISGRPKSIISKYTESRQRGGSSLRGPFFPKVPEKLVKRTIRGMLSHRQGRGENALKRIKCYNGLPKEFEETKKIIAGKEKKVETMKLKNLEAKI